MQQSHYEMVQIQGFLSMTKKKKKKANSQG